MRKPVTELRPEDLKVHAVWEFTLDDHVRSGQTETYVQPFALAAPLDPAAGMFAVRTRFTLAEGTEHTGYSTPVPQCEAAIPLMQPTIVTNKGQVPFWLGDYPPGFDELQQMLALLGERDPFPIRFACMVPMQGGPVLGRIEGFMALVGGRESLYYPAPGSSSR